MSECGFKGTNGESCVRQAAAGHRFCEDHLVAIELKAWAEMDEKHGRTGSQALRPYVERLLAVVKVVAPVASGAGLATYWDVVVQLLEGLHLLFRNPVDPEPEKQLFSVRIRWPTPRGEDGYVRYAAGDGAPPRYTSLPKDLADEAAWAEVARTFWERATAADATGTA